ncbi:MAG: T9SS type A sorting domain-containing protein [Bacteroidia bacterium]
MECNYTTNTGSGIFFDAVSANPDVLASNQMNTNTNGLVLHNGSVIGQQGTPNNTVNDNQWSAFLDYAALCSSSNGRLSTFYVRATSPSYDPTNSFSCCGTPKIEFFPNSQPDPPTLYNCNPSGNSGSGTNTDAALLTVPQVMDVINDSNEFTLYTNESYWLEKHSLLSYLKYVDPYKLSVPAIKQFYDSVLQANMGYLDSATVLLADTNGVSATDISTAEKLLNEIKLPNNPERALKTVEQIVLNMVINNEVYPTNSEVNQLITIAEECPTQYGDAVWYARAILMGVNNTIYTNNCEELPEDNSRRVIKPSQSDSTIPAKVYPNPANSLLNVEVELTNGETGNICIYNSLGEKLVCETLAQNMTILPINSMSSGIYYYRIIDNNGNLIKADKIMVIH